MPKPKPVLQPGTTPATPISGVGGTLDALLRRPGELLHELHAESSRPLVFALLLIAILSSTLYGVVVGTFSGGTQMWAAPLKITLGLLFCTGICAPSLYVFACLSGSHAKLRDVAGMAAGLIALTSLLLFSFAPVAWVFSQSTDSIAGITALHIVFWSIATYFGTRFVLTGMDKLGSASGLAFRIWTFIFVLVCLQMMTALRPIIGTSEKLLPGEKKFFLQHWGEILDISYRRR
jgi:hypothetical protein